MNALAQKLPYMVTGAADLFGSTKNYLKGMSCYGSHMGAVRSRASGETVFDSFSVPKAIRNFAITVAPNECTFISTTHISCNKHV